MTSRFARNVRKPEGFLGRLMLRRMNLRHIPLANWGFSHVKFAADAEILEAGCGGGANIARLLEQYPESKVTGLDYSERSVAASRRKNKKAIGEGRCRVVHGDVRSLPFNDESFDAVTACETIYFWPDINRAFAQIIRVLRPGGTFLIICEISSPRADLEEKTGPMNVYSAEETEELLKAAGFSRIQSFRKGEDWIAVTARKPEFTLST